MNKQTIIDIALIFLAVIALVIVFTREPYEVDDLDRDMVVSGK